MRLRRGGTSKQSSATRWALGYAAVASLLSAVTYSQTDWHHPQHEYLTLPVTLVANLVGAILVGATIDRFKHFATSRWRAGLLGIAAWVPMSVLAYFVLFPPLKPEQFVAFVGVNVCIGCIGGFTLWESPEDSSEY